jgi:PEP-CTERM motif
MFRRISTLFLACSCLLVTAVTGHASFILNLNPVSGEVSGVPGETVGWGLTLSNTYTTEWILLTGSVFTADKNIILSTDLPYTGPDPLWGIYTDLSGNLPPLAPGTSNLYVPYVPAQSGPGAVAMDPTIPYGDLATGPITFSWDVYSGNPLDVSSLVVASGSVDVNASVTSVVPEPSTYLLLTIALGVVGYVRKRMVA